MNNFRYAQRTRIEDLKHGPVANSDGLRELGIRYGLWRRQRLFDFVAGQRFRQNLPLLGRIDVQRGIVADFRIEEKVPIEMPQGRELPAYRTSVNRIGEELLNEVTDVIPTGHGQEALARLEEAGELTDVGCVRRNSQRGEPFLDLEVVEERREGARIGFGGHGDPVVDLG